MFDVEIARNTVRSRTNSTFRMPELDTVAEVANRALDEVERLREQLAIAQAAYHPSRRDMFAMAALSGGIGGMTGHAPRVPWEVADAVLAAEQPQQAVPSLQEYLDERGEVRVSRERLAALEEVEHLARVLTNAANPLEWRPSLTNALARAREAK